MLQFQVAFAGLVIKLLRENASSAVDILQDVLYTVT